VIPALLVGLKGKRNVNVSGKEMLKSLFIALIPIIVFVAFTASVYQAATKPVEVISMDVVPMGEAGSGSDYSSSSSSTGLNEPPGAEKDTSSSSLSLPPGA